MKNSLQQMLEEKTTHSTFYSLQDYSEEEIVKISNSVYLERKHSLLFTDGSYSSSDYSAGYGIHLLTKDGARFNFYGGEIEEPIDEEMPTFSQMYFEDIALNNGLKECARLGLKGVIVFLDAKNTYKRFIRAMKLNKLIPLELDHIGGRSEHEEYINKLTLLWAENRELYYQLSVQKVYLIRGHANIYGNIEADAMATKGRLQALQQAC